MAQTKNVTCDPVKVVTGKVTLQERQYPLEPGITRNETDRLYKERCTIKKRMGLGTQ
jgi:hypothetical protein